MSGGSHHNPHGRQGQPATSWNHLQVPNYFPRQPQAAHMSSERPLSQSPLTWHTPTPPEHQKGAPMPFRHTPTPPDRDLKSYRHTPTPPDVQALKAASGVPYRHTPTPPDAMSAKGLPYRHTPTPPGVPLYRHTPPPDGHKGAPSPLYNLQQMISDTRGVQRGDIRDNMMQRGENLTFSRHSPGPALGSMDLSVTRSPRNGSQNGETGTPMSLSVRDATKINSLDSAEITKIQVPLYIGKTEISKPSSPTLHSMSQSSRESNSPKSPKSTNKRPAKKMDTILERLNSVGDGVVITPVQLIPSPHSVIVSAHSVEDSNSRGSSSSVAPMVGITPYPANEPLSIERVHPLQTSVQERTASAVSMYPINVEPVNPMGMHQTPAMPHSVIMESSTIKEDNTIPPANCTNEDSDGSSSDSSRSKRYCKQTKTLKEDNDMSHPDFHCDPQDSEKTVQNEADCKVTQSSLENHNSVDDSRVHEQVPLSVVHPSYPVIVSSVSLAESHSENVPSEIRLGESPADKNNSVPVVSKARRKNSSESETIDNIAAMIASTDNVDSAEPKCEPSVINEEAEQNNSAVAESPHSPMQTEQLKLVLGSPGYEPTIQTPHEELPQDDIKPQRRKRNSKSNSVDSSNNDFLEDTKLVNVFTSKSPPAKAKTQTSFVEVENELEKMFAGIEEDDPNGTAKALDPVTGLMTDSFSKTTNDNLATKKGKGIERKKRVSRRSSVATSTGVASSDDANTPKKKRKSSKRSLALDEPFANNIDGISGNKKSKNLLNNSKSKRDKSKEKCKLDLLSHKDAYDSGSNASSNKSRGPYVQIKGPRDSPLSVSVINTPMHEEDADKPLQKIKHLKGKSSLNSDSDFRNKVKSKGLHSSTLSMKYDAITTDTSWICVFCKRGPHTGGTIGSAPQGLAQHMGDLFGPYIISTQCPDYVSMIEDPHDSQFKSKAKTGTFSQNRQAKPPGRRLKTDTEERVKLPNEELLLGMTEAGGGGNYEVWLHEDCAVWAPGLYLVGAKLVGLDSAVWGCCAARCERCHLPGASVGCMRRGCDRTMHVNCARADMWTLSEDSFMVYCKSHSLP